MKLFRKFSILFLALIVLATPTLRAQTTDATTTNFDLLQAREYAIHLGLTAHPYLMADNRVGSLVTSWSTTASIDSITSYCDGQDRYWVVSIQSFSSTDSIAAIRIDELELGSTVILNSYSDLINWKVKKGAHIEDDIGGTPLGLNLSVCAASAVAPLSVKERSTWRWYLYYTQIKRELLSFEGAKANYSEPSMDSLTLLTAVDTMTLNDTIYTAAMPGKYGYCTVFFSGTTTAVDTTACAFGLYYQVKYNGATGWSGPLDTYSENLFTIDDSLSMQRGLTKAIWPSTTPADSTRFAVISRLNIGRIILSSIKALWRD